MRPITTDTELFEPELRSFSPDASEVAFPLGGIGTGNVSLGARGQLRDWELFNTPGKGNQLPYSFFTLWCETPDGESVTTVLESQRQPPYTNASGILPSTTAGLPRMQRTEFTGEYPVATVEFTDGDVPVDVTLESYTPFIPLNPEESGIPTAILEYTIENPTDEPLRLSVAGTLPNPVGYTGEEDIDHQLNHDLVGENVTEVRQTDALTGLHYTSEKYDSNELRYSEVVLAVTEVDDVTYTTTWERAGWWDAFRAFWNDFSEDGTLTDTTYNEPSPDGKTDVGSIAASMTVQPDERRTVTFLINWYVPNRPRSWDQSLPDDLVDPDDEKSSCCTEESSSGHRETTQNHYATRFDGAWDVTNYVGDNLERLRGYTYEFRDAFFDSTLPGYVLEAVSSQISIIRSTTCMWLSDGRFLGYEGCHPESGCCHGSCTHVWNYAQTLASLFPSLEREMRRIDYEESVTDSGFMLFRTPFSDEGMDHEDREQLPATDGQLGTVMRLYREWTYSGDDAFLERLWPIARKTLEFAFDHEEWDPDEDGLMTGEQHNTYDIQFYGPNGLSQSWYLGALTAGAEMARAVGDTDAARRYEALFERGSERTDDRLWNGEFYIQDIDDVDEHRYQYGDGCLSDQLLGQWYAEMLDLGYLLPEAHVRQTLDSIFEYNFREDLTDHTNCQRVYALGDESGLLLCTWPNGTEPEYPFVYSDEVWTGIEYQVASHLIYEGRIEEGLRIVKAVRDRHDGRKRNPWNEFECGNHYARAMASWAVYTALCGYQVDLTDETDGTNDHGFTMDPVLAEDDFTAFWITGEQWGTYEQQGDTSAEPTEEITVHYERGD